jgi:hypothetical protein
LATKPAPIITAGLEVLVQLVIAATTTVPSRTTPAWVASRAAYEQATHLKTLDTERANHPKASILLGAGKGTLGLQWSLETQTSTP